MFVHVEPQVPLANASEYQLTIYINEENEESS